MAIDISTDKDGHSLRMLVWQAIRLYPTESLFQFLKDPSSIVRTIAARELQTRPESKRNSRRREASLDGVSEILGLIENKIELLR